VSLKAGGGDQTNGTREEGTYTHQPVCDGGQFRPVGRMISINVSFNQSINNKEGRNINRQTSEGEKERRRRRHDNTRFNTWQTLPDAARRMLPSAQPPTAFRKNSKHKNCREPLRRGCWLDVPFSQLVGGVNGAPAYCYRSHVRARRVAQQSPRQTRRCLRGRTM